MEGRNTICYTLCYSFNTDWRLFIHTITKAFFKANTNSVV